MTPELILASSALFDGLRLTAGEQAEFELWLQHVLEARRP